MKSSSDKKLFNQLSGLDTEQQNPASQSIDTASPLEIARIMNAEDKRVADSVAGELEAIAQAIEITAKGLSAGGRLIYAGSGTSGRLGILDASECPPTFGTDPEMVQGLIAGGREAVFRAQEGIEDRPEEGEKDIMSLRVGPNDIVCGLAASGRTPYVHGALYQAAESGAATVFVCCVKKERLDPPPKADVIICVPVGPEIITGSTRLKSGTAQKMVCNMITTGAMIRLGKVYKNVMVDLQLTNLKLYERARRILMNLTGVDYDAAGNLIEDSGYHVKTALVMALSGLGRAKAQKLIGEHGGFVRLALQSIDKVTRDEKNR